MVELRLRSGEIVSFDGRILEVFPRAGPGERLHVARLEPARAAEDDGGSTVPVGSAARPEHLVDLLLARGLVRDPDPFAVALVLTEAPPPGPPDVVARRITTFEEFAAANEVQWQAFETPEREREDARALLPQRWRDSPSIVHAAWLDGEPVCAGMCAATSHGLLLYGGATLPSARGRGAS